MRDTAVKIEPGQLVRINSKWDHTSMCNNTPHRAGDMGLLLGDDQEFRDNVIVLISGVKLAAHVSYFEAYYESR